MTQSDRISGNLFSTDAATLAADIPADSTIAVSGFGSVGYPKDVPLALAESDRDLSLTVISGGSVGEEIGVALVEADAIERRYPYQARDTSRAAVNDGRISFQDRHIARLGKAVRLGQIPSPDIAIVEAIAVGEDWLIPSPLSVRLRHSLKRQTASSSNSTTHNRCRCRNSTMSTGSGSHQTEKGFHWTLPVSESAHHGFHSIPTSYGGSLRPKYVTIRVPRPDRR